MARPLWEEAFRRNGFEATALLSGGEGFDWRIALPILEIMPWNAVAWKIKSIHHLRGIKTMIIIAHRLTIVERCDHIFRVEDGKISQER